MLQSESSSCSSRLGIVSKITTENIAVNIISMSACQACRANGVCTAFEQKEKIIYVPNIGQQLHEGEEVKVFMKTSIGLKAVLLAYILPLISVFAILLIFPILKISELLAGIISLSSLAIYYFIVYLFRDNLKKQFSFFIEKNSV